MQAHEARDVDGLRRALRTGARAKFVLFFRHEPERPGAAGPACLSQWYAAPFTTGGIRYATSEHFMMAEKARLFGDDASLARILAAPHPGAAKQLGRAVRAFSQPGWEAARFDIVVRANLGKFRAHPALRAYLVGTGRRVLAEASPVDRIWGIGLARDHPHAEQPERWRGANLLGFALMEVRARLLGETG